MIRNIKTYQFFFIAVLVVLWSAFSYQANTKKYTEGEFHKALITNSVFDPNKTTNNHMAVFSFENSSVSLTKPVDKDIFIAFHNNGQTALPVTVNVSDQELDIPPSDMIIFSQYVGITATFFSFFCLISMIFNRKDKALYKRQQLKAKV
jgi:hypothetical protein